MTYAAIAVAVVGVATTAYSASQSSDQLTSSSSSQLEFPEETRRLFQDVEKPLLEGSLQEQSSLLSPFLGGFRTSPFVKQQYGGTTDIAKSATRKGASQAGLGDLGPAFENIEGLSPELIGALQGLVTARGQQINTVVPAGYGQFLSPATFSQTSGAGPNAFQTGFQLAGSTAQLIGALNTAGVFRSSGGA